MAADAIWWRGSRTWDSKPLDVNNSGAQLPPGVGGLQATA
jgi:hypothetical protein